MSEFNFDEPEPKKKSSGFSRPNLSDLGSFPSLSIWDYLSIVVLIITDCLGMYFLTIFSNPKHSMNPFPPYESIIPTATITPRQLDPTWTPLPTQYVSPTATLLPSITPPPTDTPAYRAPSTATPILPSETPTPKAPFSAVSVNSIESIIIPHLIDVGCNWQGVGGTIDDQNNSPIIGITIYLGGSYNGKSVEMINLSGISQEYGRSGFEFYLGDTPINSKDKLYIQLLDQAGLPLSEKIFFDTSSDCKKNLVLVRFKKNR